MHITNLDGKPPLWILLLVCYLLSFGTFQTLGPLAGWERSERTARKFDEVAAIKVVTRLFSFVLVAAALMRTTRNPKWKTIGASLLPLFLFSLWGIISTLWSPNPTYSFGHAMEFLLLTMIAALAVLSCEDKMHLSSILRHLSFISFFYIVFLILLSIKAPESARILRSSNIETETVLLGSSVSGGFILNPPEIAQISSLGFILIIASRLFWKWGWARILFFPIFIVEGFVIFVTQTRAIIVTTLLLAGLCITFWGKKRFLISVYLLGALVGTAYLTLDPHLKGLDLIDDKVVTYITRGQSEDDLLALGGRLSNWSQVIRGLQTSPIVGHGYSMATPSGKMWVEGTLRHYTPHNIILHVLAGTGLIGVTLFVWGFYVLFLDSWNKIRILRDKRLPFLAMILILFVFMTGILGDSIVSSLLPTQVAIFALLGSSLAFTELK